MIVVIDKGPVFKQQLHHVIVAPTGRHGQDTGAQPVASVDLGSVLQEDVRDIEVAEPGQKVA